MTMYTKFGARTLAVGDIGEDVVELQLRLAGFRGTIWDGIFGTGTKKQVEVFQEEYMGIKKPSGIFDNETKKALDSFLVEFGLEFSGLACKCKTCDGFGQGRYKGKYRQNSKEEKHHRYEYPGIHKAIIFSAITAKFYLQTSKLSTVIVTSGYRCHVNNTIKGRSTTNHMGKAIDIDFKGIKPKTKRDRELCNEGRGLLIRKAHFQNGWFAKNRKALEPSSIAPTWIHMDVRMYEAKYLDDSFFVKSETELLSEETNYQTIISKS